MIYYNPISFTFAAVAIVFDVRWTSTPVLKHESLFYRPLPEQFSIQLLWLLTLSRIILSGFHLLMVLETQSLRHINPSQGVLSVIANCTHPHSDSPDPDSTTSAGSRLQVRPRTP